MIKISIQFLNTIFHSILILDGSYLFVMTENRNKSSKDVENYISPNHSVKWSTSIYMLLLSVSAATKVEVLISQRDWKGSVHSVHQRWHWLTLKLDLFISFDPNCSLGECYTQLWHLNSRRHSLQNNKVKGYFWFS